MCTLGACGGFASAADATADGGPEAAPAADGGTDSALTTDAALPSDAANPDATGGGDAASACPGKDLQIDIDNCGTCGRHCNPYSPLCIAGECEHLVFVTESALPGNLGGLDGADAYCTTVAANSGSSRGSAPFKAWLSTSNVDAASRFVHGKRRYLDKLSITIAADWSALVGGTLAHGISLTEAGSSMLGVPVRTATTPLGVFVGPSDCVGWTNSGNSTLKAFGFASSADSAWTQSSSTQTCLVSAHLYCIEQ
jgi:hypothetical protein